MDISYKEGYYYLDFTGKIQEKLFFTNTVNLAFSLINESKKNSLAVSQKIDSILYKMIKFHHNNKFLNYVNSELIKIKKEYLDILFEHIQTVIMIILKEEENVLEHSLKAQYEYINNFLERFIIALKEESK